MKITVTSEASQKNFKKIRGTTKTKIFSLTDSSGSDSSGESEIIAQLKQKFHIVEGGRGGVKFSDILRIIA
jgi:hypothetical protein